MWLEARRQWGIHPRSSAPPAAAPATATNQTTDPADDKPPKTFPQWARQVERYNAITLDGRRRKFAERLLAGAEAILARLWHEHHKKALLPDRPRRDPRQAYLHRHGGGQPVGPPPEAGRHRPDSQDRRERAGRDRRPPVGPPLPPGRHLADGTTDLHIYGHDLLNAHRQWPVREPAQCGTFLHTADGVTLWFHNAMCFGAAASVWNFNRAADALQQLLWTLLWQTIGHYVDDFNGIEDVLTAMSAHESFADLFYALGLRTKPSKAQAPAERHTVQGVEVTLTPEGVRLAPTPDRLAKILQTIREALNTDRLDPQTAQKLAGRLSFLTQSVFGCVGRAAIKPMYARATDTSPGSQDGLPQQLRAGLTAWRPHYPKCAHDSYPIGRRPTTSPSSTLTPSSRPARSDTRPATCPHSSRPPRPTERTTAEASSSITGAAHGTTMDQSDRPSWRHW